jgi:two-component system chemotaxis sensor kinase CheA
MSIDFDSDIFHDFLQEAGELLESLNGLLVDLEDNPDDSEILNAVFRAFHTIKGGAGFLSVTPVVELCHRSEDLFGVIRDGRLELTEAVMNPVLEAVDELNAMFESLQETEEPEPASVEILQQLEAILQGGRSGQQPPAEVEVIEMQQPSAGGGSAGFDIEAAKQSDDDITDDEFDDLLDQLEQSPATATPAAEVLLAGNPDDDITEDEFELLLDALDEAPQAEVAQVEAPAEAPVTTSPQTVTAAVAAPPEEKPKKKTARKTASKAEKSANAQKVETSVRVDTRRLDDVMNMVGELVLIRNRFDNLKPLISSEVVDRAISDLNLLTTDIQEVVMRLRMQPVRKVFSRFPRVVRDLAKKLDRKVRLQLVGEETEVDKNLVEELADPLIHLIRNAVDHGVETPKVRTAAGKPAGGTIVLAAQQEGDHILLTIQDDGAGMNPDVLRRLAVERGMMDQDTADQLPNRALYNLIFEPGFSTKSEISDVSGRGVGMDVVKTHINQLNGQIEIDSEIGVGTTITIQVPLTLAILPTLMVYIGSQNYAIPLPGIIELFEWSFVEVSQIGGREVVRLRDRTYPLIYASELLGGERTQSTDQRVLVIELAGHSLALVVDQVIGQEEVVIKPLGTLLRGMPGYSGATITGDGRVAMILDVSSMLDKQIGIDYVAIAEEGLAA